MTKNLKVILPLLMATSMSASLYAQKVDYKSGLLQVDGKDVAKVVKIKDKESFGLTSSFELHSMTGEKLIFARIATNFVPNRNDNSKYYYQFTFLPLDKTGVFSLSQLSAEKSFAKLIGESGIVVNNQLDPKLVTEMLAMKSENPQVAIQYNLVRRDRTAYVVIKDNEIHHPNMVVGKYRDISNRREYDTYEFTLPDGLVIATVSFTGGNNAQNCTMSTNKDRSTRNVSIPGPKTTLIAGADRNVVAIKRIAEWLIKNGYM